MASITKSEADWQAESDARTLAEAEAIRLDSKRYNKAKKKAKGMATEKAREAAAMKKIAVGKATPAGKRLPRKPAKKAVKRRKQG